MTVSQFQTVEIGSVLEKVTRPVTVDPKAYYQEIGIRSHGKGLFDKEPVLGSTLGDKRVFWVEPNCFMVNIVFAWERAIAKTTDADVGKIASHRFPMYRPIEGKSDLDFISYFFKTEYGRELLSLASPGGAGRNKTLGQNEFLRLRVKLPPYEDQRKIGAILSTWDRAIETVEALIANARKQKAALMQALLAGERHLPGAAHASEWTTRSLGELFTFKNGLNGEKSLYGSGVKFVNVMDVFRARTLHYRDIAGSMSVTPNQLREYGLKKGDVLFNRTSETDDEIAISTVYLDDTPAVFGGFVIRARPIAGVLDIGFSVYVFQSPSVRRALIRLGQGGIRANIGQGDLATVPVCLPPLPEQAKIAAVLSSEDRTIEVLQRKFAALREEKAALMQQLLTGKRRVKAAESEAV
ncbi:restriction endonuclease subunit S [Reyranella sp.]|uniref:restriction endonuclease subunit S n=1 Tax=Reyranella sp. TaxID=1929291 RepID=UPI004035F6A0